MRMSIVALSALPTCTVDSPVYKVLAKAVTGSLTVKSTRPGDLLNCRLVTVPAGRS